MVKIECFFLAIRNNDIAFCLSTWYKYCYLLGYKSNRHLQLKIKYDSLKSSYPNHIWCADVTIIRTLDGFKYYLHFLMDHYSKMILGYKIETSPQPKAIKELLQVTYQKYKSKNEIQFITDGGSENVNTTVSNFIESINPSIIHLIAQKTFLFLILK